MTGRTDKILRDDLLIIKRYTPDSGHTVSSGDAYSWTTALMKYAEPEGYVAVGIAYIAVNNQYLGLSYFTTDSSNKYGVAVRNGSGSSASSVKPVIDIVYAPIELVEVHSDTTRKLFKRIRFAYQYTSIANSTTKKFTPEQLNFYIPDGYQIFSITEIATGSNKINTTTFDPFNTDHIIQMRNISGATVGSSSSPLSVAIDVTFIRSDYAEKILESA